MTKEDLFREDWWNYQEDSGQKYIIQSNVFRKLEKFFDSNVCIPKGENRHPDADAIHHLAERTLIVEIKSNEPNSEWGIEGIDDFSYCIKPHEPIYEWQWYSVIDGCVDDTTDTWEKKKWLTEKEMIVWGNHWRKFEETKRERK